MFDSKIVVIVISLLRYDNTWNRFDSHWFDERSMNSDRLNLGWSDKGRVNHYRFDLRCVDDCFTDWLRFVFG